MDNKQKRTLGISLVASAITMLFTLIFAGAKNKKLSRVLSVIALLEALAGLFVVTEEPRRQLMAKKRALVLDEDEELFSEDEADDAVEVIRAELSHAQEADSGAPRLHIEVPCDEEACEEDFV